MGALVSGIVGAVLASIVVFTGVTTYSNLSTTDTQKTSPTSVPYADQ
jgi:hypothetical protein